MAHRLPLADIQFIAEFAAFARAKGDERYNPALPEDCALAQFGHPCAVPGDVPPRVFNAATLYGVEYTFSALADRLEALLADTPTVERGQ